MSSSLFYAQGMADHLSHEPAKGFFSQYGQAFQIIGIGCQSPAAGFGDQIGIRVPESADLRYINPRFNTDHHIFLQDVIAAPGNKGTFMVAQSDAVSGPVEQIFFITLGNKSKHLYLT